MSTHPMTTRRKPAPAPRHALARCVLLLTAPLASHAQEVMERVIDEQGQPRVVEQHYSHAGLLRARDLTPFGLLRLDMLQAHTAEAEAGTRTPETQSAYHDTFATSAHVRYYLDPREGGH